MHPSPLNPKANKNYIGDVENDLKRLDVLKYLLPDENSKNDSNKLDETLDSDVASTSE